MSKFQPFDAERPQEHQQACFEDDLPMYRASLTVKRYQEKIFTVLQEAGAQYINLTEGLGVGERPAFLLRFVWHGVGVEIVTTALPIRDKATDTIKTQAKRQVVAWLLHYLEMNLVAQDFMPNDEIFVSHMLPPGSDETIAEQVKRQIAAGAMRALPEAVDGEVME